MDRGLRSRWDRICTLGFSLSLVKWVLFGASRSIPELAVWLCETSVLSFFSSFTIVFFLCSILQRKNGQPPAPVWKPLLYVWQEGATENIPMVDTEGAPDISPPNFYKLFILFLISSWNWDEKEKKNSSHVAKQYPLKSFQKKIYKKHKMSMYLFKCHCSH